MVPSVSRITLTPNAAANRSTTSGAAVAKRQIEASAPTFAACAFIASGVSCAGSKLTERSRVRPPERAVCEHRPLHLAEPPVHQRTELRQGTSDVDEGDHNGRVAPCRNRQRRTVLIGQRGVGHGIARADRRGKRGRGKGGGGVERRGSGLLDRRQPGLVPAHHQPGGHQIARRLPRQQAAVSHFERHRHPGHEALDVAMFDQHFSLVESDGQDLAFQLIRTRRVLAGRTGGERRQREQKGRRPAHGNPSHESESSMAIWQHFCYILAGHTPACCAFRSPDVSPKAHVASALPVSRRSRADVAPLD